MARNFTRSSRGVRPSRAWASTRSLKSSHPRSRSIQTSDSGSDISRLRTPASPIETIAGAALITFGSEKTLILMPDYDDLISMTLLRFHAGFLEEVTGSSRRRHGPLMSPTYNPLVGSPSGVLACCPGDQSWPVFVG